MALNPVAFIAPNYRDFPNYWLKVYEPSTVTPKTMFLDAAGSTTAAKLELNAQGFLRSSGGALVIPYINGAYDAWLFPTEAEADANDTTNAIRVGDNVIAAEPASEYLSTAAMVADAQLVAGDIIDTLEHTSGKGYAGGNRYLAQAVTGAIDDNGSIIKSTGNTAIEFVGLFQNGVNALQFGADLVDDSVAIQAMIDYLVSTGLGGEAHLIDGNFIYSKTIFLQSNITLNVHDSATLRPKSGMGNVAGTGLFVTIAAMSRYRFGVGTVIFKGAIAAYQGPHVNVRVINDGVIEGTLHSAGTHDVADAAGIHFEDAFGIRYRGDGLIENCDNAPIRVDGTGVLAPNWTTLALADGNTTIGNAGDVVIDGMRSKNTHLGFESQNYTKRVRIFNFTLDDCDSHAIRLVSARDVTSYGHTMTNILGSSYQMLEGKNYNLFGSMLAQADQIAIQIAEVDNLHIHGNNIYSGQISHNGVGPAAERVYISNNVWVDANDEWATGNGLINPTLINQLIVREVLPNNAAKTIFESKTVGAHDSYRVYMGSNQTGIVPGVYTKIEFDTIDFQDGSSYDVVGFDSTPSENRYIVQGGIRITDNIADGDGITVALFKSGVEHANAFLRANGTSTQWVTFQFYVDVNGFNDLDVRVDPGGALNKQILSGATNSRIEVFPAKQ